jgi:hypothetical protein
MSQPRSDEQEPLPLKAIWTPADADANPIVIGGTYGDVQYALVDLVDVHDDETCLWTYSQSAWRRSERTVTTANALSRFLCNVSLDVSGRLDPKQVADIKWRGALLQLPANRFGVVAHGGVPRLARFTRFGRTGRNNVVYCSLPLSRFPEGLQQPAANDVPILDADIILPGPHKDGTVGPGITGFDEIAEEDRAQIRQFAVARHRILNVPQYALRLPGPRVPANAAADVRPQAPQPQPIRQDAGGWGALDNAQDAPAVGKEWTVTVTFGATVKLQRDRVQMVAPGTIQVLTGTYIGRKLSWPIPPTVDGQPVTVQMHSLPASSRESEDVTGWSQLNEDAEPSATDILTWFWLDGYDFPAKAIHELRQYLHLTFKVPQGSHDPLNAGLSHVNAMITWARTVLDTEGGWRSSPNILAEGRRILWDLCLVEMHNSGYDISTLRHGRHTFEDVAKEKERQDRAPRNASQRGGQGASARRQPGAPASGRGGYDSRVCKFCKENGVTRTGHTDDTCWEQHAHLRPANWTSKLKPRDFRAGGAPLRK